MSLIIGGAIGVQTWLRYGRRGLWLRPALLPRDICRANDWSLPNSPV